MGEGLVWLTGVGDRRHVASVARVAHKCVDSRVISTARGWDRLREGLLLLTGVRDRRPISITRGGTGWARGSFC